MELVPLIKSRAHRILRRLDSYYHVSDIPFGLSSRVDAIPLADGEELIGVYVNSTEGRDALVFVTTRALHILADGEWRRLIYQDVEAIETSSAEEKHLLKVIRAVTGEGVVDVPVTGGRGRFRDAWPFVHFLRRVVDDTQSRSGLAPKA
jgi:hypothetical protein